MKALTAKINALHGFPYFLVKNTCGNLNMKAIQVRHVNWENYGW